jgi:hypothetical protein
MGSSGFTVFEFSAPVNITSYYLNKFDDDAITPGMWKSGGRVRFYGHDLTNLNALGLTSADFWTSGSDMNRSKVPTILATILATNFGASDRTISLRFVLCVTKYTPDPVPGPAPSSRCRLLACSGWWRGRRQKNQAKYRCDVARVVATPVCHGSPPNARQPPALWPSGRCCHPP